MFGAYMDYARMRESGGNPLAKNPRSSAEGLYQFIDGTWGDLMRNHPDLGLTPDGRRDPAQQERAMKRFTELNAGQLQAAGFQPTDDNLYAAHRFGAKGATDLLKRDPNTPIADVVSQQVLAANPDLVGKTIAQALSRKGGGGSTASPPRPSAGAFGALLGLGGGGGSGDYDLAGALQGAGASLMAIDNPQGAAVLAKLAQNRKTNDQWSTSYDPNSGALFRLNRKTGEVQTLRNPYYSPERKVNDEWEKAMTKSLVERNEKIVADADRARLTIGNLDQLQTALSNPSVYQGFGGEAVLGLKKAAQAMGLNVEGVADSELASKVSKEMALQLRNPAGGAGMPGALSDSDRKFLAQMTAGIDNSYEGNMKIIEAFRKVNERALEIDRLRGDYIAKNGRLDEGFNRAVREHAESKPLFAQPTQRGRPDIGTLKKKYGLE